MTGVKGAGGPPPKRSDQRRRANAPAAGEPTKIEATSTEAPPKGDPNWHPVALAWFESLGKSGQAIFYQASDWSTAAVIAESMSREFQPQPVTTGKGDDALTEMVSLPPKGASLAAWLKGMTALLATEGDRRRAAIELQRPLASHSEAPSVPVTDLRSWRASLG